MEKYQIIKKLGSGSFGHVQLAQNKQTKEIVAIKQLKKKYGTWQQCLQLSEVKALRKMNHPNIIKLKEVIRVGNQAYFVFEYIEKDLYKLITQRKEKGQSLSDSEIRYITKQLIEGLNYIHKQGFFHRDLKPENILIDQDFSIKLIDFGIARQIRSKPPFTQYVSTRWYRAPQILFKFSSYSAPVDIFALGCIVAQMYMMRPLFLGNSQMDQITKIISVLGSPAIFWPQGQKQASKRGIHLPEYAQLQLSTVISSCPADGINFISQCLRWDPSKRQTTSQLLQHPYIEKIIQKQFKFEEGEKILQNKSNIEAMTNSSSSKYAHYKSPDKQKRQEWAYKDKEKDDEFDKILNSFTITSTTKNQGDQDDDF